MYRGPDRAFPVRSKKQSSSLTTPRELQARAKNFSHSISSVKRPTFITLLNRSVGRLSTFHIWASSSAWMISLPATCRPGDRRQTEREGQDDRMPGETRPSKVCVLPARSRGFGGGVGIRGGRWRFSLQGQRNIQCSVKHAEV